jgi:8-oxo-dGTP diphosphatase
MANIIRVVAALLVSEKKVLIAQRPSRDAFPGLWEFPGGKVKKGERDEDALKRECEEELGIKVNVHRQLCDCLHHYPHISVHLVLYWCERDSEREPRCLAHQNLIWVTAEDILSYSFLEADRPILPKIKGWVSSSG